MLFFFQAEDGRRDDLVTGVQTCALPILGRARDGAQSFARPSAGAGRCDQRRHNLVPGGGAGGLPRPPPHSRDVVWGAGRAPTPSHPHHPTGGEPTVLSLIPPTPHPPPPPPPTPPHSL